MFSNVMEKSKMTKTANKNQNLYDISDVCDYFNLSEATIRRRVRESRNNTGTFPLPLFKSGQRLVWRKVDIEGWAGEDAGAVTFTPSMIPAIPQMVHTKTEAQVHAGLKALGVNLN